MGPVSSGAVLTAHRDAARLRMVATRRAELLWAALVSQLAAADAETAQQMMMTPQESDAE